MGSRLRWALVKACPEIETLAIDLRPAPGVLPARVGRSFPPWFRSALRRVTHLVHLAADLSTVTAPPDGRWRELTEPVGDLRALVESLPALNHVVFSSSYMVYAVPPPNPVTEHSPLWPINAYGWVKCAVESYLRMLPIRVCNLRFTGVYGPGVPLNLGRAVTEMVSAVVRDHPVTLHQRGTALRNHVYLGDAVQALFRAVIGQWKGTFNVAGPDPVSVRDVVDVLGDVAGRPLSVRWVDSSQSWDAVVDTTLLAKRYGFRPDTGIRDGLRAYYDWARELVMPASQR